VRLGLFRSALSWLYAFCRGQRFPVGYQDLTARSIQFARIRILYGITKHKTLNKPLYPIVNSNRLAPPPVSRARNSMFCTSTPKDTARCQPMIARCKHMPISEVFKMSWVN